MRLGLCLLACVVILFHTALAEEPKGASYVSLQRLSPEQCWLSVDYPWHAHAKASIEVRLVTEEKAGMAAVAPIDFVAAAMKGEVETKVSQCLQAAYNVGQKLPITHADLPMEIIGQRNSLGKPAVCVAAKFKKADKADKDEKKEEQKPEAPLGAWTAFCLLDCWSMNRHTLHLDLPREYFAKPGKLHVWFLRDGKPLWQEQLDWPGY